MSSVAQASARRLQVRVNNLEQNVKDLTTLAESQQRQLGLLKDALKLVLASVGRAELKDREAARGQS